MSVCACHTFYQHPAGIEIIFAPRCSNLIGRNRSDFIGCRRGVANFRLLLYAGHSVHAIFPRPQIKKFFAQDQRLSSYPGSKLPIICMLPIATTQWRHFVRLWFKWLSAGLWIWRSGVRASPNPLACFSKTNDMGWFCCQTKRGTVNKPEKLSMQFWALQ